jgi:Tfp pilus assembly protein PilF
MIRCDLPSPQFVKLSTFLAFALLLLLFALPGRAQTTFRWEPDAPSVDKKAEGTISVRDLTIPPKAFEEFQRGLLQLERQDAAGSVLHFRKAIEKYPKYFEAYYHLGVAQKRLGQEDQAMSSFQSAIDLSSGKYALAAYAYGLLLCKQGRSHDAERTVRYALELQQNRALGQVVLATVFLYEHRPDDAEKSARDALSVDPNTPDAYLVLAGVDGEKEDYASEVNELDQFLSLEPQSSRSETVRGIRDVAQNLAVHAAAKDNPDVNNP